MSERNYLVFQEFPMGASQCLGKFGNLSDAMIFLEAVIEKDFQGMGKYSIQAIEVSDSTSVRRYNDYKFFPVVEEEENG